MFVKPIGADGKMQQNAVKRFRDVGINYLEIGQPVAKDDVTVLRLDVADGGMRLPGEIRRDQVTFAGQVDQDIAEAEKIITICIFTMAVIEIEIDPSVIGAFTVDQNVITSNVAMFLPHAVQKADRFDTC